MMKQGRGEGEVRDGQGDWGELHGTLVDDGGAGFEERAHHPDREEVGVSRGRGEGGELARHAQRYEEYRDVHELEQRHELDVGREPAVSVLRSGGGGAQGPGGGGRNRTRCELSARESGKGKRDRTRGAGEEAHLAQVVHDPAAHGGGERPPIAHEGVHGRISSDQLASRLDD